MRETVTAAPSKGGVTARAKRILTMQLAGANFSYYLANAAAVGYLAVYLNSQGYSSSQIGTIAAINSALGIFAAPLWGMLADRWRSVVKVIVLCAIAGGLLYGSVPLLDSIHVGAFPIVLAIIPMAFFFRMPVMSLTQSVALEKSERTGINFGILRAAGSLSFALGSIALGLIVPRTGVWLTFYIAAAFAAPTIILILLATRGETTEKKPAIPLREMRFGELLGNRRLMSFFLLSVFACIMLNCNSTFWPRLLESIGEDGAKVGLVNGTKAFVEVPFMIMIPFLRKRFKLENILIVSFALFTAEAVVYVFAASFWQVMVAAIVCDGVGAGLYYATSATFVFSLAPERLSSTAQAILGAVGSVTGVVGSLIGGFLIDTFGIQSFYIFGATVAALATCAFVVITHRKSANA